MMAGVDLVRVPHRGDYMADVLDGQVQVAFAAIADCLEQIANSCFGLDHASVAEIRAQTMEHGAAVLLISEDLDGDHRVAVMSEGRINYVAPVGETDRATICKHID
jgi:hypothetical protein